MVQVLQLHQRILANLTLPLVQVNLVVLVPQLGLRVQLPLMVQVVLEVQMGQMVLKWIPFVYWFCMFA